MQTNKQQQQQTNPHRPFLHGGFNFIKYPPAAKMPSKMMLETRDTVTNSINVHFLPKLHIRQIECN